MGGLMDAIEFLGIPGSISIVLVALFLIMQIVGELVELSGKVVPEFLKVRKYFKRIKQERQEDKETLREVKKLLNDVNNHYNEDNITKRNDWMNWVNDRAIVYDRALNELTAMKDTLISNNELTLDLYINVNRHRILDFASKVVNEDVVVSREEFNRIFKVYNEYEEILEQHNKTNGEVDVAIRIIREAYETRMRNHTFIEDLRGYNNTK